MGVADTVSAKVSASVSTANGGSHVDVAGLAWGALSTGGESLRNGPLTTRAALESGAVDAVPCALGAAR